MVDWTILQMGNTIQGIQLKMEGSSRTYLNSEQKSQSGRLVQPFASLAAEPLPGQVSDGILAVEGLAARDNQR